MARLNVNPTRMELKKLKARLSTAVRGHKLLKDKSDEMVRRFTVIIREDKRLREEVEQELSLTLKQFSVARSVTPAYRGGGGRFLCLPSRVRKRGVRDGKRHGRGGAEGGARRRKNARERTAVRASRKSPARRTIRWEWCPRCLPKMALLAADGKGGAHAGRRRSSATSGG